MSHVYVTSDWHFGHKNVTRFRSQFPSMVYMEDHILENHLDILTKRDVLYCIGDMAFDRRGLDKIAEIPCRKILVRGNHDTLKTRDYLEVFDEVEGAIEYKNYFITHIPIHPMELYRRDNIHGHCHRGGPNQLQKGEGWGHYFNAILEFNDYRPVRMDAVKETLDQQKQEQRSADEREAGTSERNQGS